VPFDWEVTHSDGAHFTLEFARTTFPEILWMEIIGPEIDFYAKFHNVHWASPDRAGMRPAAMTGDEWRAFREAADSP
jgi:hypothetical protein